MISNPLYFKELAENVSDTPVSVSDGKVNREIVNYYKRRNTDIKPEVFEFDGDLLESCTASCSLPVDDIEKTSFNFSCFSEELLDKVGFNLEETWNGESSFFIHDGEVIKWGSSDYYTGQMSHFCLYSEALSFLEENSRMKLREYFLHEEKDFMSYPFSSLNGGSVIFQKRNGTWKLIIGKRSNSCSTANGLNAKIPHGGVEPVDFESCSNVFYETARREFGEETSLDEEDFDEYTEEVPTAVNWQIKSGNLGVCYTTFVEEDEEIELNNEFQEIYEINVQNSDEIKKKVNLETFAAQDISDVFKSLILFDEKDDTPSLEYELRKM